MGEKIFEFGSFNLLGQLLLEILSQFFLSEIYYTSNYSTITLCLSLNHMEESNMIIILSTSTENRKTD